MKTFYIFELGEGMDTPTAATQMYSHDGDLIGARASLKQHTRFPAGRYLILEDTSGILTKGVKVTEETSLEFDAPRKRGPRQPKAEDATATAPKKAKK